MNEQVRLVDAVRETMRAGGRHTLQELRDALRGRGLIVSEAGVSARVRDLRKAAYGGHTIQRQKLTPGSNLFTYRMVA